MHPYSSAEWESLFLAEAGASAALAGLLFVALSINLEGILKGCRPPRQSRGGYRATADTLVVFHLGAGARAVAYSTRR